MSDFVTIGLDGNTGTNGSPTWTALQGASHEIRWSDVSTQDNVASASWPYTTRVASSTAGVDYAYGFTADAVGTGILGNAGPPTAFSNANYMQFRWNWDNVGTFAAAPIMTSYPSSAHGAITRNDGSLLGGSADTTGGSARSYLKGNLWGRVTSAGAPGVAPTNAPVVTDGTTGSVNPTAGANWLTNYQGLQGDNDYITFPNTPAATTADTQNCMMRLFQGVNMNAGTYTWVCSLRYLFG